MKAYITISKKLLLTIRVYIIRTYTKTLHIAHDNFDELHALSHALEELCVSNRLIIFIQKTNSNSSQITFFIRSKNFTAF